MAEPTEVVPRSATLNVPRELTRAQREEFAERGYIVIPDVVPQDMIDAANAAVDEQLAARPPAPGHVGVVYKFQQLEDAPVLASLLRDTAAFSLAESLTGPGTIEFPESVQTALTYPPFKDAREKPHIDGGKGRKPDDPPWTFTMLAGFFLTDQSTDDQGNLFVWPGTHRQHAKLFRDRGPDAFTTYPNVELPERDMVRGKPGDMLLKHYLLGHNGGNNTGESVRRTVYFRLRHHEHEAKWRDALQDAWHDYAPLRGLVP
ncbi:phytanoyl-CoA dioxygenase family protein [Amycolatopsis sp. OK19-0408]|uniref:Phytanoyl-CoA dioxygenase family protein n=1 Tax=Amycolatopsis iheyensis TaxID=2945988 RepID=A0A9X2NP03_9PSEU|nr:phytanoyl-CoA dioxygenase family protein [Amycolatopsis iheyensis]MCR6488730.1 phytanoyl-CoA dioxygenase family protein [Amycolatopsis iheyensis]